MTLVVRHLARPPMLAALDLELAPGVIALVGPNGAGKTTLLRAIAGLTRGPGTVTLDGRRLGTDDLAWLPAEREIGFALAARDVVALGLSRRDDAAVERALARTGATGFADRAVSRLSTGERARVLVARAIVARPRLLLLDEPAANLDPAHALSLMALLAEEAARGAIVVATLHDLELARRFADTVLLLDRGALVASGIPDTALAAPHLAATFGIVRGRAGWERLIAAAAPV